MKEQLLKRKLNPFLLITTVLVLAILAGLSVMYQSELGELVSTRNSLQNELDQTNQKVQNLENMNKNLNSTIRTLEKDLQEKNSQINQKNQEISSLETQVQQIQSQLEKVENQYSKINGTVQELNETVKSLNFSLELICGSNVTQTDEWDYNYQCEAQGYEIQ